MGVVIGGSGLRTFELDESHDSWPKVQHWIVARQAADMARTEFSKQEIAEADWLELTPDWHHGYPQPDEGHFGYLRATYDLSGYCAKCGSGLRQKAPFQMKGEPKWGRRSIMQLNWVFDEYFVTPELWKAVFEPRGIERRPVSDKKGNTLQTVVQLVVAKEVSVATDGLEMEGRSKCTCTKYRPVKRGYFPALTSAPTAQMVKTREYFGSGFSANKAVLVSQELARALTARNARGASFMPVAAPVLCT
jgi:hypothetical protein